MPTVTYNENSYSCTTALKGENYIHLLDTNGRMTVAFDGVVDFSGFSITGGNWTTPATENECHVAVLREDGTIGKGGHKCTHIATLDKNGKVMAEQSSASYLTITGDTTITSDHEGKTLKVTADAMLTLGELTDGCEIEVINYGATTVTLSGSLFVAGEGSATACTIDENSVAVCKYMDAVWFVAGGVSV